MAEFKKCEQEKCTVHKDGVCLESIDDIEQCPHFYLEEHDEEVDEESENNHDDENTSTINVVKLFDGDEISLGNLTEITYRYPTNRVYILGEHDSGKTTLLATLFEMFQVGPFHGFHYAGSMTQIGFEKRCFHSRIASKNTLPDTERTKSEEFHFLHISLKQEPLNKNATHFLISDISGEKIKRAKNNTEDMKDLALIAHAHHVSFFIDGKKLSVPRTRQGAIMQAKTFIRKAIDEGIFSKQTRLTIVISKWDLLDKLPNFDVLNLIEVPFRRDFSSDLPELKFLNIAIRPTSYKNGFKLGHGLIDLINLWLPMIEISNREVEETLGERMIDNYNFKNHG